MPRRTKEGNVNAVRLLHALGRIGYDPTAALLDIADNAVSARATTVRIFIRNQAEPRLGPGRRRARISSFLVADDGSGMDEDGIHNALTLGSPPDRYTPGTLSKFGMGLKSAASALGSRLEIVSSLDWPRQRLLKATLDQSELATGYRYTIEDGSREDESEFTNSCPDGHGTLVRVLSPHTESLPSFAEIDETLRARAGVIFCFQLSCQHENQPALKLLINGDSVEAVDPLFAKEAASNLEELSWDGTSVCWITREKKIQLKEGLSPTATLEITQLPHPPSMNKQGVMSAKECREKYLIEAGNYGFYVYRNRRLISWADRLAFFGHDQDLYSFRGRLLIESDADEILNLDVTKSRIQLSEHARTELTPHIREAMHKSKAAWAHRSAVLKKDSVRSEHDEINEQLNKISRLEDKDDKADEDAAPPRERDELKTRRRRAIETSPATEQERALLRTEGQRVQHVDSIVDDQLWERAHDADLGLIVRVSQQHRFFRELVDTNIESNPGLIRILDVFFFALARGEYSLVYKSENDANTVERIMREFRVRVGGELSEIVRRLQSLSDQ